MVPVPLSRLQPSRERFQDWELTTLFFTRVPIQSLNTGFVDY